MSLSVSPAVLATFDDICALVGGQRRGLTLEQLRDAYALARELDSDESDQDRVEDLAAKLGVDVEALS